MEHSKKRACRVALTAAVTGWLLFILIAIVCSALCFSATALATDQPSTDPLPMSPKAGGYLPAAHWSTGYLDVGPSYRYAEAVAELSRRGCISGYDDNSFAPDTLITRQQFTKVLALALGLEIAEGDVCEFSDVALSGPDGFYPDNYVAALAARGIVVGTSKGRFSPHALLRRRQIDTMLTRSARLVAPHIPSDKLALCAELEVSPWTPVTRGEAVQAVYEFIVLVETLPEPASEGTITGLVRVAEGEESEGIEPTPGARIAGATVTIQARDNSVATDDVGRFEIDGLAPGSSVVVTAWSPGYFIGASDPVLPGTSGTQILLWPIPHDDDSDYEWLSAYGTEPDSSTCERCHSAASSENAPGQEVGVGPLPFDEWVLDAHARSASNPRFLTMYTGTDLDGNQSPPTRYVWDRDYGSHALPPDSNQPYFGPGYQLDFPGTKGNCATCHVPVAALEDPYGVDPTTATGVAAEGIGCDFCHKVWNVVVDPGTGLPHENAPGVLSLEMRRPSPDSQFFAGPFADVAPGHDTYSALQKESLYCASCHTARFWGTQIYDSYGEWLASPYSDPDEGQTCQDCHMPSSGSTLIATPEAGGNRRDPETVRTHLMPGAADVDLLQAALTLAVDAQWEGDRVNVAVTVTNDKTGHHVPTDSPLRQVLLVVQAEGADGRPLEHLMGPILPEWAGEGADVEQGRYAGLPGTAYAKILREPWTGVVPSGAYWNPTVIESDTRLAALASDATLQTFAAPAEDAVGVHVTLVYRRAFFELAEQKGWDRGDIVMAEWHITLAAP